MEKGKRGYRYDEAFKREAVALVIEKSIPTSTAAKQPGVAEETLRQWIAKSGVRQHDDEQKSDAQRIRDQPCIEFFSSISFMESRMPLPAFSQAALNTYLTSIGSQPSAIADFSSDLQANFIGALAERFIIDAPSMASLQSWPA